jgi:Tol biopolymer transport system component
VPGSTINPIDNIVSAPITHFSTYSLYIRPNAVSGAPAPTTLTIGQQTTYSGSLWYYHTEPGTQCRRIRSGWHSYTQCYTTVTHYSYPIGGAAVLWSSSNPSVASAIGSVTYTNSNGMAASPPIRALAAGTTDIRGNAFGMTSNPILVTVLPPLLPPTFVLSRVTSPGIGDLYTMAVDGSNSTRLTTVGNINTEPAVSPNGQRIAWRSTRSGSSQIWVMNVDGSAPQQLTTCGYNSDPSWSPDGTRLAYHSNCAGNSDIWIMNADGTAQTRVTSDASSEGAPDWSPDGQWIGFTSDRLGHNDIWIMRPDGSMPRAVTNDATLDSYLSWSPDARHLAHRCGAAICVSDAYGATTTTLVTGGFGNDTPKWSRDGATIAFQRSLFNSGGANIWTIPADGSAPAVQVTPGGGGDGHPEWLGPAAPPPPPAYMLARCPALCDLITVSAAGSYPTVFFSDGGLNTEPAISPNGQRVAWRGANNHIVVMDRDGSGHRILTSCGYNSDPSWSPDGQRIAYHSNCTGLNSDVWVMNADGTNPVRVTTDPASDGTPVWSPDGQWIAFSTNRNGPNDIWIVRPDGTDARAVTSDAVLNTYIAWSPDSQRLAHTCGQSASASICVSDIASVGSVTLSASAPFADSPHWGGDGLISFNRLSGGGFNIWTIRPDGTGLRRLTLDPINQGQPVRFP